MLIHTSRVLLRDFREEDRAAFIAYQMDPRYLHLYRFGEPGAQKANRLFSQFLDWQSERPRRNFQVGLFQQSDQRLCGCAGLRAVHEAETAVLGIELAPDGWGRYCLAVEVAEALIAFGFDTLGLKTISGETSAGNRRAAKLARWFGAETVARRPGPEWLAAQGWEEVRWSLACENWRRRAAQEPAAL